jgi:hypothetical protein
MAKKGNSAPARNNPTPARSNPAPARNNPAPAPARVQTNAGVNPMGSPKAPTLSQNLKIAGTGGITKQELKNITEASGKSGGQVIQRLDKINQNLKAKDQTGINLNSGAANMLIKEAGPAYGGMYGLTQKPTFGTGRIGQTLESMRGTRATGGYQNPQSGYGRVTSGTAPSLMMGGTAIRPGGREVVQGFGKQFQGTMPVSNTAAAGSTMPTAAPTEAAPMEPMFPELPELPEEEEQPDININMDSLGANLANWASGFKTARSSRQRAGRGAQGLASQRVAPSGTWRYSV